MSDQWRASLVKFFGLPREIVMSMPLIMLLGDRQIYLEQHRGIESFTEEEIKVLLASGSLRIRGSSLIIEEIVPECLKIKGNFSSLSFIPDSGGEDDD